MEGSAPDTPPLAPSPRLTAGLMLGVGVHAMEGFSVSTALPAMTADLDARPLYAAVLTTYLLATVLGLSWAGQRADSLGPAPPLGVGLLSIGVGLVGATAAPGIGPLLVARVFQGFGAGALTTVLYALVQRVYEREARPAMLAKLSLAWGGSAVALPGFIGWLVDAVHWRAAFAFAIPVVVLTAWLVLPLAARLAPELNDEAPVPGPLLERRSVITGALVLGGALLFHAPAQFGAAAQVGVAAIGGLLFVAGLWKLLPRGAVVFAVGLPAAVAVKFIACASFFGTETHLPLCLTDVHGRSSTFVGITMAVSAMSWSAMAFVQAAVLPRIGSRAAALIGMVAVCAGVGLVLPLALGVWGPYGAMVAWVIGAGGMGFVYNTVSDAAMAETPPERAGDTGMALGVADALGAAAGAGLASAFVVGAEPLGQGMFDAWSALLVVGVVGLLGASRVRVVAPDAV